MHPKHAEGMANGADPDQTAPLPRGGSYVICMFFRWRVLSEINSLMKPNESGS